MESCRPDRQKEPRNLLSTVSTGGDHNRLDTAHTASFWWSEINAFLQTDSTNARTEGYNRLVKQVKRAPGWVPESRQFATHNTIPQRRKQPTAART